MFATTKSGGEPALSTKALIIIFQQCNALRYSVGGARGTHFRGKYAMNENAKPPKRRLQRFLQAVGAQVRRIDAVADPAIELTVSAPDKVAASPKEVI
jgi:hypothetical protein